MVVAATGLTRCAKSEWPGWILYRLDGSFDNQRQLRMSHTVEDLPQRITTWNNLLTAWPEKMHSGGRERAIAGHTRSPMARDWRWSHRHHNDPPIITGSRCAQVFASSACATVFRRFHDSRRLAARPADRGSSFHDPMDTGVHRSSLSMPGMRDLNNISDSRNLIKSSDMSEEAVQFAVFELSGFARGCLQKGDTAA